MTRITDESPASREVSRRFACQMIAEHQKGACASAQVLTLSKHQTSKGANEPIAPHPLKKHLRQVISLWCVGYGTISDCVANARYEEHPSSCNDSSREASYQIAVLCWGSLEQMSRVSWVTQFLLGSVGPLGWDLPQWLSHWGSSSGKAVQEGGHKTNKPLSRSTRAEGVGTKTRHEGRSLKQEGSRRVLVPTTINSTVFQALSTPNSMKSTTKFTESGRSLSCLQMKRQHMDNRS